MSVNPYPLLVTNDPNYEIVVILNLSNCSTFIGPASAPTLVSITPTGFSGLSVNITIPDFDSVCVDEYQTIIDGGLTQSIRLSQAVIETRLQSYTFDFTVETCRDVLIDTFVTVVAITNGLKGVNVTKKIVDNLNRVTVTSQTFSSAGLRITLIWKVCQLK